MDFEAVTGLGVGAQEIHDWSILKCGLFIILSSSLSLDSVVCSASQGFPFNIEQSPPINILCDQPQLSPQSTNNRLCVTLSAAWRSPHNIIYILTSDCRHGECNLRKTWFQTRSRRSNQMDTEGHRSTAYWIMFIQQRKQW